MKKKIAFLYIWENPPIRKSVEDMLIEAFPDFEVEPIGIGKMLKQRPALMALNELSVMSHYGADILAGKKGHSEFMVATPYLFHQVRRMMREHFKGKTQDYAFAFQLQSLFDTSQPDLPHFIYTDRTVLANLAYPNYDPRKLYAADWIQLEKEIYQHARLVFTRSSYISQSVQNDYQCAPEKTVCVYAGSNSHARTSVKDPTHYASKNILFVGVNYESKGGPDLAQAFQSVLERHPDASLTIIGSSPKIDLPQVEVLGYVPLGELAPYYERAAIFCLPTKFEAFGVAFIEAMENALPIVGTQLGAIPDFVTEGVNGHLVPPENPSAIATALLDLLDNPERCRLYGENSRKLYLERYNWHNTGQLIRQHILGAIAGDAEVTSA